ncbi:secreted protein [gut metagenome]|uniref:Secreted protein n=1 Tax=gut metagenome TaxID=749906 RepID=J9GGE2_9ZZZZ
MSFNLSSMEGFIPLAWARSISRAFAFKIVCCSCSSAAAIANSALFFTAVFVTASFAAAFLAAAAFAFTNS